MANLCDNTVILLGNPRELKKVRTAVDKIWQDNGGHKTGRLSALQKIIGFDCEGWGRTYDVGLYNYEDDNIEKGELTLNVVTAWGSVDDFWNALSKNLGLQWCSYSSTDEECFITNDVEGIYFQSRYVLDPYDDDFDGKIEYEVFNSKDSLVEYMDKKTGIKNTFDEWMDYFDGQLKEILVDGSQAHNPFNPPCPKN